MKTIDEIRQKVIEYEGKFNSRGFGEWWFGINGMDSGQYKIAKTLLTTIENLEAALHVVTCARDVLLSKDHVLTELARKVCIMGIGFDQHAEYVDELKAFLEANKDNEHGN